MAPSFDLLSPVGDVGQPGRHLDGGVRLAEGMVSCSVWRALTVWVRALIWAVISACSVGLRLEGGQLGGQSG